MLVIAVLSVAVGIAIAEQPWYDLPELPPPYDYGSILINRSSAQHDVQAVSFSHWQHRIYHTCRVCHFELAFEMKVNATEITEEDNRNGEFCGACHNGIQAFGHTEENCKRCHTGRINSDKKLFGRFYRNMPKDRFGNKVDWSRAIGRRVIKPKQSIFDDSYTPLPFEKVLTLEAEMRMIPPAIFPHRSHTQWLDCANCHPYVFNIKKKTTKHFSMNYILEGKFCGACHLNVAFPLDDCKRCHPDID